jgi:branched-chain amino acid transport system permease protein
LTVKEKIEESGGLQGKVNTQSSRLSRLLPFAVLFALIVLIPRFVFRPEAGSNYYLSVLTSVGIYTILAVGLNLLMGYAGQVSLGHAAYFGIGAYVSARLTVDPKLEGFPPEVIGSIAAVIGVMVVAALAIGFLKAEKGKLGLIVGGEIAAAVVTLYYAQVHWLQYAIYASVCLLVWLIWRVSVPKLVACYALGWVAGLYTEILLKGVSASGGFSPWYAMVIGIGFTCLVAYLIGAQALRLRGHYLAMATLGFGVIVSIGLREWAAFTQGTSGITEIPALKIAGRSLDNDVSKFYIVWAIAALCIVISSNVIHSRVGRAFRAVHGSETAAAALGVDTARYKLQVFVLSAGMASIAGSLYAHFLTMVAPEPFGFKTSVELVVMVVVGGMASVWGAIFGAGSMTALTEFLRGRGQSQIAGLGISLSDLDVVLFGLILVVIMIFLPQGILRGAADGLKSIGRLVTRKKTKQADDGRSAQ